MNVNLIRGKMAEMGLTQARLAKLAGMSSNSLSRKLSGKRDFKLSEVNILCRILGIKDPAPYFFESQIPYAQRMGL
jgi:transcriptional regulator with XRE-family HTH domain